MIPPGTSVISAPRSRTYLLLLLAWMTLIFVLTSIPNPSIEIDIPHWDKMAHAGVYGGAGFLCVLWRRASGRSWASSFLEAALFVAVAGAVDEAHQRFIPGREMDVMDWTADVLGGGTGAVSAVLAASRLPFLLNE